jgi:hypothetical protein
MLDRGHLAREIQVDEDVVRNRLGNDGLDNGAPCKSAGGRTRRQERQKLVILALEPLRQVWFNDLRTGLVGNGSFQQSSTDSRGFCVPEPSHS